MLPQLRTRTFTKWKDTVLMFLLLVPQTRAHCSQWSLPQDHGLCCWCDRVSCVCTETQSMRQCLSRSFVLSKIKCEWRSSSHRLALGCAKPFGVFVEEVSQRNVCFFPQRDRWFAGHSRIKAKAKLHSDVIRRNRGSQRLSRFTLVVRLDVDHASSECLVGKFLGTVDLFMHIFALFSWSWQWHGAVSWCVDVRFVGCHSVCCSGS